MLRGAILDIKNQSYSNIFHSVNISLDNLIETKLDLINKLFDDLICDKLKITYHNNKHQHINHMNAIFSVDDWNSFDIFVKIDDDDIYKKNYVKNICNFFEKNEVDVLSSSFKYQLNGNSVRKGIYQNLGANPKNCDFKMPATFAFNKKALLLISNLENFYAYEDNMWRDVWCKNCKIAEIDNTENVIWNIHGKNTTTSDFLINE